jgi:hypothetical protein
VEGTGTRFSLTVTYFLQPGLTSHHSTTCWGCFIFKLQGDN